MTSRFDEARARVDAPNRDRTAQRAVPGFRIARAAYVLTEKSLIIVQVTRVL